MPTPYLWGVMHQTTYQLAWRTQYVAVAGSATTCVLILPTVATTPAFPPPSCPSLQAKLAAELSAAGLTTREFDWGDLARLPYLNAVIKESLRLFAPASMGTSRMADKDMVICGYNVPKVSRGAVLHVRAGGGSHSQDSV
jgi:cytochrome P450